MLAGFYADTTDPSNAIAAPCPTKTWQPGTYGAVCLDCYKGRYCPLTQMSSISDYTCSAGYVCDEGNDVADPNNVMDATGLTVIGRKAAVGYYRPTIVIHEYECPDGFYSEAEGLYVCAPCPTGQYCDNFANTRTRKDCIPGNTSCRGGNARQLNCPAGMYEGNDVCNNCTASHYCRAGEIADKCAAGYICNTTVSGLNSVPDPPGAECPPGTYCPKGSTVEVFCP